MHHNSASEQEPDDSDGEPDFVEVDPTGRYGRYKEALGKGAFKKVYRAFDELEGIEVAWNQVKVADLLRNSVDLERLYSEVHLLKTLKHKNIIKFYNSWIDSKNENINFITEVFTSGTLRQYRKKHKHVDLRALKKWSRQILEGLSYLHSHDPPVIHRDLKCDNLFVNGNQGEVKIGDLGLAAILHQARSAHSVIGTPEFMAPELYEEEYDELVDIYAFGMCLLELVTFEYPYVECTNAAQIFKKVTAGIKPASLAKVKDPDVKAFIETCIAQASERLSAKDLLKHPFLLSNDEVGTSGQSSHQNEPYSDESGELIVNHSDSIIVNHSDSILESGRDFTIEGQRTDLNTIFLKLRIADSTGQFRNIHFPFNIEDDTATAVASEMVEELDLSDQDVSAIAEMINSEIRTYITDWEPREHVDTIAGDLATSESETSGALDGSPHAIHDSPGSGLVMERLPSGRKYWCDSPKEGDGTSPHRLEPSNLSHTDSSTPRENLNEETYQSSDEHTDESQPLNTGSAQEMMQDRISDDEFENDIAASKLDISSGDISSNQNALEGSQNDESNPLDTGSPQEMMQDHISGDEFENNIAASKLDISSGDISSNQKFSEGSQNDESNPLDTGSPPLTQNSISGNEIEENIAASKWDIGSDGVLSAQSSLKGLTKMETKIEETIAPYIGSDGVSSDQSSLKRLPKTEMEIKETIAASKSDIGFDGVSNDQRSLKGSPKTETKIEIAASKSDIASDGVLSHQNSLKGSPKTEMEIKETIAGSDGVSSDQNSLEGSPKTEIKETIAASKLEGSPKTEIKETIAASKSGIGSDGVSSYQSSLKASPKTEEAIENVSSLDVGFGDISSYQNLVEGSPNMEETNEYAFSFDIGTGDTAGDQNSSRGSPKMEETNEFDQSKIIAEKLDQLLAEQKSELDELVRKHELAVSELLKEFSPEIHQRVIDILKQRIREHKLQRRALLATNRFKASTSSLQKIIEGIHIPREDATEKSGNRKDAYVPVLKYSFSSLKRRINSDPGIAVILGDEDEEC